MLCVPLCREPEPAENHLKDMLQQLNTIIAAKPSEKPIIRQGECGLSSCVDKESKCCKSSAFRLGFLIFLVYTT